MTKAQIQRALISIFIGAAVTFATVFLEGLIDMLQGYDNNIIGGAAAAYNSFKIFR